MQIKKQKKILFRSLNLITVVFFLTGVYPAEGEQMTNEQKLQVLERRVTRANTAMQKKRSAYNHCRDQKGEEACLSEKKAYRDSEARLNQETELRNQAQATLDSGRDISLPKTQETAANRANPHVTIEKVREKRGEMETYAILGLGTTAFLGYKTSIFCSTCASTGSACKRCAGFGAATVASGVSTIHVYNKKNRWKDIENKICATGTTDGACKSGEAKTGGKTTPEGGNLNIGCGGPCPEVARVLGNSPESIRWDCSDSECSIPEEVKSNMLQAMGEEFAPEGGWGEGENPFEKSGGFSYDNLSDAQKKAVDDALKPLKQKQQAYLEAQLGEAGEESTLAAEASDSGATGATGTGTFSGSQGGYGQAPSTSKKASPKKKETIADQMKRMLAQMNGSEGSLPQKSVAGKSVQVGSDVVGVQEDNIFMMVHRRHREMDENESFIKEGF